LCLENIRIAVLSLKFFFIEHVHGGAIIQFISKEHMDGSAM